MKIREIKKEDNAAIAEIIRNNLEKYGLDVPGTAYFDPGLDRLSDFYLEKRDKRRYFILEGEGGKVLGGVGLAEFELIEGAAELQKMYLADEVKGRGLGKMLVAEIEDAARKLGYKKLYLETHSNLTEAVSMYERKGFTEIPRPDFVRHGFMDRFFIKEL